MRHRFTPAVIAFAALVCLSAAAQGTVLQDQFGTPTSVDPGGGTVSAYVVCDRRDSADRIAEWMAAIKGQGKSFRAFGVTDLHALPFFIPRSAVISDARRRYPATPILLDWAGSFVKTLGAPADAVTVLVFGPSGRLAGKIDGEYSPQRLAGLLALIDAASNAR
jgi:hypothetical protein